MRAGQRQIFELHIKVHFALRRFFHEDKDLLHRDANERSTTHKLAEHLQLQFHDLKVDCEYNRHVADPKKLCGDNIVPDIVVHERGCDRRNALVIEVKKSNGHEEKKDECKLRGLTSRTCGYGYALGLFLVFDVRSKTMVQAECYRDGDKSENCRQCAELTAEFAVQ